jgi:hypothetical protein
VRKARFEIRLQLVGVYEKPTGNCDEFRHHMAIRVEHRSLVLKQELLSFRPGQPQPENARRAEKIFCGVFDEKAALTILRRLKQQFGDGFGFRLPPQFFGRSPVRATCVERVQDNVAALGVIEPTGLRITPSELPVALGKLCQRFLPDRPGISLSSFASPAHDEISR